MVCALVALSCATEPSGPYLKGTWASPSLGATASQAGLRLIMVCGGNGWFDGPLSLDSLNIFTGSGYVQFNGPKRPEIIVGQMASDGLSLVWGPPDQPPNVNGPMEFMLPAEIGHPTEDPCSSAGTGGAPIRAHVTTD